MLTRRFAWALRTSQSHPDFKITSNIYSHPLGCNLIHLDSPDDHKAFAVLFRTTPQNDSGVAHCLEHIALCGSRRFPVRDPFMKMLSRSLNSYMNAWTGSDFTMYPFSTKNEKDFKNLLDVYLDASFFPLIKYEDFLQEAWRLEGENENLVYKGVVFN
jgi:Zn-dependent M16 (insulinase) family peptidase